MTLIKKVGLLFQILCFFYLPALTTRALAASPSLGTNFVEIRAINNGKWDIKDQTPAQILQLVKNIRTALGAPFNVYRFYEGQVDPNMPVGDTTLDNYLVEIQQAAGGAIIPVLSLDYYNDVNGNYPCTDGTTGPTCFWETSSGLLSLTAIANGPHVAVLNAWETFNRCSANPNYCDPATIKSVLQQIKDNGWDGGIISYNLAPVNAPDGSLFFSDQGEATFSDVGVSFPGASPWMTPYQNVLDQVLQQEPYLANVFVTVDTQAYNCPSQSQIDQFLANLDSSQKAISLTQIAQNQASGHYIFVYPVAMFADNPAKQTCNNYNGDPGFWDAATSLQDNGQPFINLIESLMTQYNQVSGNVQLITRNTLSQQDDGNYAATVTVTNEGPGTVEDVVLTGVTVGTASGTPTPQTLGGIIPGGYATATVVVPSSAGTPGSPVVARVSGTYTGGTFGASFRETLP